MSLPAEKHQTQRGVFKDRLLQFRPIRKAVRAPARGFETGLDFFILLAPSTYAAAFNPYPHIAYVRSLSHQPMPHLSTRRVLS
jgi:hypothetical protein